MAASCISFRSTVRNKSSAPLLAILCLSAVAPASAQSVITRGEQLSLDVSAERDEVVFNLLGDLWTVRAGGGVARRLAEVPFSAGGPRWSPDSRLIAFDVEAPGGETSIHLVDTDTGGLRAITPEGTVDRFPAWHPDGQRVVFSSKAGGADFDLWEIDLATGLRWRLGSGSGDDLEPAWSADGRHLTWIRRLGSEWQLMLRRFGQPEEILVTAGEPLRAPSWRPDGTLITFFRETDNEFDLQMIILSDPPLERTLIDESGLYPTAVAWRDRRQLFYSAEDRIKTRDFDDWNGQIVTFRASLAEPAVRPAFEVATRELPIATPAAGRLVIRSGRLFDGFSRGYREGADVLIEDGLIADVTATRDWGETPIIDLSSTTMLPGLIDMYAALPADDPVRLGARLLSFGVTTVVAEPPEGFDPRRWESEATPGPRLLPAERLTATPETGADGEPDPDVVRPYLIIDVSSGEPGNEDVEAVTAWQGRGVPVFARSWRRASRLDTALVPAGDRALPANVGDPQVRRPGIRELTLDLSTRQLVSSLADRDTPGLSDLLGSRLAHGTGSILLGAPSRTLIGDLRRARAPIALGSAPNGLPAGIATHAELLALTAARLPNDQTLKAAGRQAAAMLGLSGQIGEISVGAQADLLLVTGDPLKEIGDLRKIVAVVRNGRFYSLVNLLERRTGVE